MDKTQLVIHLAGVRYRKALDTRVTEAAAGRVRPEQIAAFREQRRITLDSADAWLAAVLEDAEGGLVSQLRAIALPALIDDLLTNGSLPPAALQQRTLFEDVARPLTQEPGLTVLLVVDALRYEMAEELYRTRSDTPLMTAHLQARLAELPTVTEVGMNVRASQGERLVRAATVGGSSWKRRSIESTCSAASWSTERRTSEAG